MPKQLDLIGRRFGHLTVTSRNGSIKWGKLQPAWLCRCDCGAMVTVPQDRLPHRPSIPKSHVIDRCEDCRARPCEICSLPVPVRAKSKACSKLCEKERQRRKNLRWYHEKMAEPEFADRRRQRARDRYRDLTPEQRRAVNRDRRLREVNSLGRDEINRRNRASYASRMADPETASRYREMRRSWREKNPDTTKRYSREWRRNWRKRIAVREMRLELETRK